MYSLPSSHSGPRAVSVSLLGRGTFCYRSGRHPRGFDLGYGRSLSLVKNKTILEHSNSNPTGKVRSLFARPRFLCVLDELLEPLIVDIVYGPFWHLVAWEVSPKLHVEQNCAACAASNKSRRSLRRIRTASRAKECRRNKRGPEITKLLQISNVHDKRVRRVRIGNSFRLQGNSTTMKQIVSRSESVQYVDPVND